MPSPEHANTPLPAHAPVSADPVRAALVDALADLRQRYRRALILGGTAAEYADAACERADAALALARGAAQHSSAVAL